MTPNQNSGWVLPDPNGCGDRFSMIFSDHHANAALQRCGPHLRRKFKLALAMELNARQRLPGEEAA